MRKSIYKKIIILVLALIVILLTTACQRIAAGEVYKKEFKEAYTDTAYLPVYMDEETCISVPYTTDYPDRYIIYIREWNEKTERWISDKYYVGEELYNNLKIGDYISFESAEGTTEEPYTKTEGEKIEK